MAASQTLSMWLPWFLLLSLGLVPVTAPSALEESMEPILQPPVQDVVGQDPSSAHPWPDQTSASPAAVPQHEGLSGAMTLTGISHHAHGRGANGEGNKVDALKSSLSKDDDAQTRERSSTEPSVISEGSSLSKHTDVAEVAPCFTMAGLGEALSALHAGRTMEREFGRDTLAQFGICTENNGSVDAGLSALSTLATAKDGDNVGPWGLHLHKELWVPGEEAGSVSLTFEVPLAFEGSTHLNPATPTVLLFFVASKRTEILEVTFNSDLLLPNKQTACLSERSQFIILTRKMSEPGSPRQQTIQITVKSKQTNKGPKHSLPEVQDLLMRHEKEAGIQKRPLLVFVPNEPLYKDKPGSFTATDHSVPTPVLPPPSRTYQFLCELQRFLSDVLPGRKGVSLPARDSVALPLAALSSLPPLVLGVSSSESLLSGLLSSSTPVLFSFPQQRTRLRDHRVALSFQAPLLSMLREQLADALMRFQSEEVGKSVTDTLQNLRALSALPSEEEDPSEADGEASEDQYHALLLLKALQTVLGVWEADRAQRAARGGEESPGKSNSCHLESLTINLEAFFLQPPEAVINNCEGECGFPLPNGTVHAILLNSLVQRGDWVGRAPCCVPTEYEGLMVYELDGDGTKISTKPNIKAKECGCR